jgi:hypothetical protein
MWRLHLRRPCRRASEPGDPIGSVSQNPCIAPVCLTLAADARSRGGLDGTTRQAAAITLVLGALLIWWFASPVAVSGGSSLSSLDWPLLVVPALFLAAVAGVPAGLLVRHRRPRAAIAVLWAVSLPALYPPLLFVGDWPGEDATIPTDLSNVIAALVGWALFVVAAGAIALLAAERGRPRHRSSLTVHP